MNGLLTIAVLSLMLPLRMETDFVLVRPFEFLIGLGLICWPIIAMRRGVRYPAGFVLLLPYFLWYLTSATPGGSENVAREGVQVAVVTAFAFLLAQETPWLDMRRISRRLLWGVGAIATGMIIWHVSQGYWVGWKLLPDPRLAYVFLPTLVAGLILFAEVKERRRLWFIWAAMFPLLLLSGERKALVVYLVLTGLLVARGRLALVAPVVVAGFIGLFVLSTMINNPHLQKQVQSLVDPAGTGNYEYVIATGTYLPGDTPSAVQRAFALDVSRQIIDEHPLAGIGTNQFVENIEQTYPDLPGELRVGIHGEFQRVLTENGIVGLMLYLMIWASAWVRLSRLLRVVVGARRLTSAQARIMPLCFFIPFAVFLGTEAPGTRAFVGIIIISLLPEIARTALARGRSPTTVRFRPSVARPTVKIPSMVS